MIAGGFGTNPLQNNGGDYYGYGKIHPGLVLFGTEVGSTSTDIRQIAGQTWIVSNAIYEEAVGGYTQTNATQGSSAIVLGPGSQAQLGSAPAAATAPIPWTFTSLTGIPLHSPNYFLDAYGADPSGVNYSDPAMAAILAAIAISPSGRGTIVGGAGTYKFQTTTTFPNGVYFEGQGIGATVLSMTSLLSPLFQFVNIQNFGVSKCTLQYSASNSTGKLLSISGSSLGYFSNVWFTNWGFAIYIFNSSNLYFDRCFGIGTTLSVDGIYATATDPIGFDTNELHITNCVFGGLTNAACITGSAYHFNGCAAVWMTSCDSFNALNGGLVDPGPNQFVSNFFVSNCSFDFGTNNSFTIQPTGGACILMSFENCWFSGGLNGLYINSTNGGIDQLQLTNLRCNNCQSGYGIYLIGSLASGQTNLTNISIVNPITVCNYIGGISLQNVSQVTVIGGFNGNSSSFSNPPYVNQQKYAFNLLGTNNNISLIGHTYLSTNCLSQFSPGSTLAGLYMFASPGFNVPNSTLTFLQAFGVSAPASGTYYQNNTGRTLVLYISGGTVTFITVNGVLTGLTSGTFVLTVESTIAITFSAAPTIGIEAQ